MDWGVGFTKLIPHFDGEAGLKWPSANVYVNRHACPLGTAHGSGHSNHVTRTLVLIVPIVKSGPHL